MTTLTQLDVDFALIFDMKSHPRITVRDALTEHCTRLGFAKEQIKAVIEAAEAKRAGRPYTADAIEAGKDKARAVRSVIGGRPVRDAVRTSVAWALYTIHDDELPPVA